MKTASVSKARSRLYRPNAIMIGQEDWRAIQETLYLLSIPGMRESIKKGMRTPLKKCGRRLDW